MIVRTTKATKKMHAHALIKKACKNLACDERNLADHLDVSTVALRAWKRGSLPHYATLALCALIEQIDFEDTIRSLEFPDNGCLRPEVTSKSAISPSTE